LKIKKSMITFVVLLIVFIFHIGCESADSEKSIGPGNDSKDGKALELKAVTALEENAPDNAGLFALIDKVNELGEGKVHIEYLGGPEAVPKDQQPEALKNGSIDISWIPANYMASLVPTANAMQLSNMTGQEERQNNVTDLWNDAFKQANSRFLLRGSSPNVKFHFYTTKPVESLEDFKGLQMRSSETYQDVLESLEAEPVSLNPDEIYTALQRGTVDGYGWPGFGLEDFGWDELTEYMVDPGFYQFDIIGLMNLDAWDNLPDDVKDIFNEAAEEIEEQMVEYFDKLETENRKKLKEQGAEIVELNEQDADELTKLARDTMWDKILKADKEFGSKIKSALEE